MFILLEQDAPITGFAIKVNSADTGFTATDMNEHRGMQAVWEGAVGPVRLVLLSVDIPTLADSSTRLDLTHGEIITDTHPD